MPIFKPELIDKILAGQKTQTRRPVKPLRDIPNRWHINGEDDQTINEVLTITEPRDGSYGTYRSKWAVGSDYAIVPGRGKHSIYARQRMDGLWEWQSTQPGGNGGAQWLPRRIRVTRIRQEDVRDISHEDALAEGFSDKYGFLDVWTRFYDGAAVHYVDDHVVFRWYANRRDKWVGGTAKDYEAFLRQRPDNHYQAWALDFTLVRVAEVTP